MFSLVGHVSTCVDLGHLQVILNVGMFLFLLHLYSRMTLLADVVYIIIIIMFT